MAQRHLVSVVALAVLGSLLLSASAGTTTAAASSPAGMRGGVVAPDVTAAMASAAPDETVSVLVLLGEQADLRGVRGLEQRSTRLRAAVTALQATANRTQGRILGLLRARQARGLVVEYTPYWIHNGVAVTATPAVIAELAALPEVASVTLDQTITAPSGGGSSAAEPNIDLTSAPSLWALGYDGAGVVVANMDTGVDVSHPDLSSHWRGGSNSWYDPNGQHATPTDVSGHGTWTMGVMVGGDAGGTAIGMAPGAKWIAVKIFNDRGRATTSKIHSGFQWLLDPDGNPATPDAPNVVNNSWDLSGPGCDLSFELDLENLRAAGILPVFAAGNSGPGSGTSVSPANNPGAFAVGETNSNDVIQTESARGPSACGEPSSIYPELVAPGAGIRSSDLYGGYITQSGTSLSAPHVSGALALLLAAFPDLGADDQSRALSTGAVDLGSPGADNSYGAGRLDALAAYESILSTPDFSVSATPTTATTLQGASASFAVSVAPRGGFTGDVSLALTGLTQSQAPWSFSPPTIAGGSGSSTLTITPSGSLAPGSYPLVIAGSSGALTRSAMVTLVVEAPPPPPDFTLGISPSSASVKAGGAASYAVSVASVGGFTGVVSFSAAGLPQGASVTFTPPTVTGSGDSTMSIMTSANGPVGSFSIVVTGSSGGTMHSATVTLTVEPPAQPDFTIGVSPSSQNVKKGKAASYTVSIGSLGGFTGAVSFSAAGLPTGASATFTPSTVSGSGSTTMRVTTSANSVPGTFSLTVTGTSGALSHQSSATLVVTRK